MRYVVILLWICLLPALLFGQRVVQIHSVNRQFTPNLLYHLLDFHLSLQNLVDTLHTCQSLWDIVARLAVSFSSCADQNDWDVDSSFYR